MKLYLEHSIGQVKVMIAKHWHKIERAEEIKGYVYLNISYVFLTLVIFSRVRIIKLKK